MTVTQLGPKLLSWATEIDENTIAQARETASMPFVVPHVALMPDAHSGKGAAVGAVIPTDGAVIPASVGVDVGCGMSAVETRYTATDLEGCDLSALRAAVEEVIPLSMGNYNISIEQDHTAERIATLEEMADRHSVVDLGEWCRGMCAGDAVVPHLARLVGPRSPASLVLLLRAVGPHPGRARQRRDEVALCVANGVVGRVAVLARVHSVGRDRAGGCGEDRQRGNGSEGDKDDCAHGNS